MITDDFNRADQADLAGASGYGWAWSKIGGSGTIGITSNAAVRATASLPMYRADYETGSDDNVASADVGTFDTGGHSILGRVDLSTGTCYEFYVATTTQRIYKWDGVNTRTLIDSASVSPSGSGEIKISCIGTTITGFIDGVQVIQTTDSTYSTGECCGIGVASSSNSLDNFSAQAATCNSAYEGAALCLPMQDAEADADVLAWEYGVSATAATLNGAATTDAIDTTGPGKGFASALDFDGAANYVSTSFTEALGDFSVFAWFFAQGELAGYERVVDKDVANGFWMGRNNVSNEFGGGVRESSSPFGDYVSISENVWNAMQMSRNGTSKTIHLNGSLGSTSAVSDTATDASPVAVGRQESAAAAFFNGYICGVLVWTADTSAQAADLYAGPEPRYESGAVLNADGTFDLGLWDIGPSFLDGVVSGDNAAGGEQFQARLRGPDGDVLETLAASSTDTGTFAASRPTTGTYYLEGRKENDGGWSSWAILDSETMEATLVPGFATGLTASLTTNLTTNLTQ